MPGRCFSAANVQLPGSRARIPRLESDARLELAEHIGIKRLFGFYRHKSISQSETMRENLRKRFVAILVAGLLHGGLILFGFALSSRMQEHETVEPMTAYFFDEQSKLPLATSPITPARTRALQRPPQSHLKPISPPAVRPEEPGESPIPDAPRIDWAEQAQHAAEDALARREADGRLRSFGFPQFSEPGRLPRKGHVLGDVEHFEGGETIDWINNRCYYTNRGIADFASEMGPGPKKLWLPVCKHR